MRVSYMQLCAMLPDRKKVVYRAVASKMQPGATWLVPVNVPNAADYVHYAPTPEAQKTSQGYGGSTLTFELEDGAHFSAKGPWHSNADSLYGDTGIDIRCLHYTAVAVGFERGYENRDGVCGAIIEPLYADVAAVLGAFHRDTEIAQALANLHNKKVYVISASQGGGHGTQVVPVPYEEVRK